MAQPSSSPDHNLGTLIGEISHLMRLSFNRRARNFGLTQQQWRAIACVRRAEGINQAKLAEVLEIQPISLARLIDRMEASGWIERRPDPDDRRAVKLFLTPKAEPILVELRNTAADLQEIATAGLSDDERAQLLLALGKIKANLLNSESANQRTA